jgi:RNA polymerase sigma-70 factor (ECF subfamily)
MRLSLPPELAQDPGVDLMLRYQEGDEQAFDRLVERYSPRVYALVSRFLGPVDRREDLVQEVFLRVIRARARYLPEARFSTWLYRIVFHLCVNEGERGRAAAALEEEDGGDWPDERSSAPVTALERQDRVQAVRAAIQALPARQRMALVLAKYEELDLGEVGRVLGTSVKAVKSMIHRARETLRERLAPLLEEEPA